MKKSAKIFLVIIGILVLIFSVVKIRSMVLTPKIQKQTRFLMDTYCTIQAVGLQKATLQAIEAALDRMEAVDHKFNMLNPKSPLYAFNNFNTPISDSEIVYVLKTTLNVCNLYKPSLDITLYPVIKEWGFFTDSMHVPDSVSLKKAMSLTGLEKIDIVNGVLIKKDTNVKIDLGAVAKGYAIREAVNVLRAKGITSALVEGGGEIYTIGNLYGMPWKVGIRNPRADGVVGVLKLTNKTIATSGDYERFFEKDGVRYHHIIDPSTGFPARGFSGISVIHSDPFMADVWSTTLFVMGPERTINVLDSHPEIQVIMISPRGTITCSKELRNDFEILKKGATN